MAELVGVTSPVYQGRDLKRALLLFDRIAVPASPEDAGITIAPDFFTDPTMELRDDIDWLCDQGLVFNPIAQFKFPFEMPGEAVIALNEAGRYAAEQASKRPPIPPSPADFAALMELARAPQTIETLYARAYAILVREQLRINAVGMSSQPIDFGDQGPADRTVALRLIFHALPLPSDSHSFEDVLAFRKEVIREGLMTSLRVWTHDMAAGNHSAAELSDRLEYMVATYRRGLELERMEHSRGLVEILVMLPAEILAALLELKFSKIAESLFAIGRQNVSLLKAERNLEGRELAYIFKAHEMFRT